MPIREPEASPPFRIVRVSHVELGVRDLAAARAFYVDCLGLLVTQATADALCSWVPGSPLRGAPE